MEQYLRRTMAVIAAVVALAACSPGPHPGDVRLRAFQFEWDHTELAAKAGRVAVFVSNQDTIRHDFTIEGVVARSVPAERALRLSFQIQPGVYRFYCSIHPDAMEGTLTVAAP
jgi:plastocyanin